MRLIFHQQIKRDLRAALSFYDTEGGSKLGDRFFAEAEAVVAEVTRNPKMFHFVDDGLRRAALTSFPYHFLLEEGEGFIHFLVLRHDKRHPAFGLKRRRMA
jgi:hypothetical protein